jgi:alkylation response protein AidB-like acyl-CoA dehydrogenase
MRLTEEQLLLRDMAREFAWRELAPRAVERDRAARFPKEALGSVLIPT